MVQREFFDGLVGSALDAVPSGGEAEAPQAALTVDRVDDLGAGDGTRFSVFFSGPADRFLPQGTYAVAPPGGEACEVFVVPIGLEGDRYLYEAAFNREGG